MIRTHKSNFIQICTERGYNLEEAMQCVAQQDGDMWTIDEHHEKYPKIKIDNNPIITKNIDLGEGVGTELKKILSWFNINSSPNCSCNLKAKMMNDNGIEWCKYNKDLIISWLKEESLKRNLPFFTYAAKKILNIAISKAERKTDTCS
jgi:hypothetical protein